MVFVVAVVVLITATLMVLHVPAKPVYGFTYSTIYAESLDLQAVPAFTQIVQEIPFRFVRLPVYWSRYEPINDLWSDQELQSLLDIAQQNDVAVILAIGQKVPRWPECFIPSWAKGLEGQEYDREFLAFTDHIVNTFGNHPALERWQIENESYFPFGECVDIDPDLILAQKQMVRMGTPHIPIQTTVSGEQGLGFNKAPFADIIGFSLYRTVSTPMLGKFIFPHIPFLYRVQSWLVALGGKHSVISELQAEPWGVHEFNLTSRDGLKAAAQAFTPDDLAQQLIFARQTGMREISVWGVEWWLSLANHDEVELWESAKTIFE